MTALVSAEYPLETELREVYLRELLRKKTGLSGATRAALERELARLRKARTRAT